MAPLATGMEGGHGATARSLTHLCPVKVAVGSIPGGTGAGSDSGDLYDFNPFPVYPAKKFLPIYIIIVTQKYLFSFLLANPLYYQFLQICQFE